MPDSPAKTTVCLPYVLVPKMDTSSRLFHKAQNTIAKQVKTFTSKSSEASPTSSVTTSATKTHIAKLFHLDNGMSSLIFNAYTSPLGYFLSHPDQSHWLGGLRRHQTRPRCAHRHYYDRDTRRRPSRSRCISSGHRSANHHVMHSASRVPHRG